MRGHLEKNLPKETIMEHKSMTAVSANRLELLQISDAVAREKTNEKEMVLGPMEEAI